MTPKALVTFIEAGESLLRPWGVALRSLAISSSSVEKILIKTRVCRIVEDEAAYIYSSGFTHPPSPSVHTYPLRLLYKPRLIINGGGGGGGRGGGGRIKERKPTSTNQRYYIRRGSDHGIGSEMYHQIFIIRRHQPFYPMAA
jgi:hypothetical protein